MTHLHHKPKRLKRQFGHDLALEERIEQSKDDEQNKGDDGAGLELEEREVAIRFLETGLDAIDLLGFGLFHGDFGAVGLHGLELLSGFVDGGAEGLVGVGAVDEKPGDGLANDGGADGDSDHREAVGVSEGGEERDRGHCRS